MVANGHIGFGNSDHYTNQKGGVPFNYVVKGADEPVVLLSTRAFRSFWLPCLVLSGSAPEAKFCVPNMLCAYGRPAVIVRGRGAPLRRYCHSMSRR